MIIIYFLILIIGVFGIKINFKSFYDDYLSKESTLSVKGLFVLFVFCRHFKEYIHNNNILDIPFYYIDDRLGQLIVVMFLFYSGYGIAKQIQKKDGEYIRSFLQRRLLPVWIRFAICVALFVVLDVAIGKISHYSLQHILLSFIGWYSVGNSNWFMCVTFMLYLIAFISFRFFRFKNKTYNLVILSVLSMLLLIVLYFVKDRSWWNTLLCFPLGMWYASSCNKIERLMKDPKKYFVIVLPLSVLLLGIWAFEFIFDSTGLSFIPLSLVFALTIVFITMKIKIGNRILDFFGKHIFSFYILQRMPMILFKDLIQNDYLYFITCFAFTVAVAMLFDYLCDKAKYAIRNIAS